MSREAKKATKRPRPEVLERKRTSLPIALLASTLMALAAAWATYRFGLQERPPGGEHWYLLPLVAVAFWATADSPLRVKGPRMAFSMTLAPAPVLIGLAFLPPVAVVATAAGGFVVADVQRRREAAKASINTGAFLPAVTLGSYAYHQLVGSGSIVQTHGWVVAFATAAIVSFSHTLLALAATAVADRRLRPMSPLQLAGQVAVGTAVCASISMVGESIILDDLVALPVFLLIAVVGTKTYVERAGLNLEASGTELLYDFTKDLAELTDVRAVVCRILDVARQLLSAQEAEIVVPLEQAVQPRVLRARVRGDGEPVFRQTSALSALDKLALSRGPLLLEPRSPSPELRAAILERGLDGALAAPLNEEDVTGGYLLVGSRPLDHENFDRVDLGFFTTLAANAGVGLRSCQLVDKLRSEIVVREFEAHHDTLTGVANRTLFNRRLDEALLQVSGKWSAVMMVDLDNFKDVNDTLGHSMGDKVLRLVAERLSHFSSGPNLVCRFGGDEFAVLVGSAPDQVAIEAIANQLLDCFMTPFELEGIKLDVRASIGVAVAPLSGRGRDPQALMRRADIAMYIAKENGGGLHFYDPGEDRSTLRRLTLATELRRAIDRGDLELWYQPVVQLGTGEVLGCEALLRWNHQQFGPVPPAEFIPVAEGSGLIDPLTWWVLDEALEQVKAFRSTVPGLRVSVNISARSLVTAPIVERVTRSLYRAGVPPEALTLELTESCMMRDTPSSELAMRNLSDMGISLAIDDYGTGFSSLSRLKELPFQDLKIDRSFVKEMMHDRSDEAIVRSTIELARSLGRTVTAEGVEDKVTLHRLASLGCHAAQGYYLAKPLPASKCELWLADFARWPSNLASMEDARNGGGAAEDGGGAAEGGRGAAGLR
jgi:diguanylate cyclase (GGDEF)-like protein